LLVWVDMAGIRHIRNYSIIAHIDHGKSTLADRFLELTKTIEKRKMTDQVLDRMELEKERGITIKMKPVRMEYVYKGEPYVINLIDTPGHIDFSYEVSRALKAVEGAVLLVDATQGVQAQTLTTLGMAREAGLTIIPVVSKIDSPLARTAEVKKEIAKLLGCAETEVLEVSGKTGEGVEHLLQTIIDRIPPPAEEFPGTKSSRSLIFDFQYSNHTGVIVFVRVFDGTLTKRDVLKFVVADRKFTPIDIGIFSPMEISKETIGAGEIGFITTGIKEPGIASVGDTITEFREPLPLLLGYDKPRPVVWASLYPESQDDFNLLRQSLLKLKLSDSSFMFEEESSGLLGRGFRCGFLGMLHLEIITERLKREFNLSLIVTTPSITYEVINKKGERLIVYSPAHFPDHGLIEKVFEPWVDVKIILPDNYVTALMPLFFKHEAEIGATDNFGDGRSSIEATMPLRELMRNFFDEIKSATSGFASFSYKIGTLREAEVAKLEILVADEVVPAFTRVVSKKRVQEEAEAAVEKLHGILPRQMFATKIQGQALGRILSSRSISALRKDVTGYLYGGDITRKMKLLEKQKKGKKRMKERGRGKANIPQEVFMKMIRKE